MVRVTKAALDRGQVGGRDFWILRLLFGQRDKDGTLGSADQMQKPLKNKQGGSRCHIEETRGCEMLECLTHSADLYLYRLRE